MVIPVVTGSYFATMKGVTGRTKLTQRREPSIQTATTAATGNASEGGEYGFQACPGIAIL